MWRYNLIMKLNYNLLLALFFAISPIFAQKSLNGFPKLTQEQLNLTNVSYDKDANAVILAEEGDLDITGGNYQLKVKRRIKILKSDGLTEGDIELLYYKKNQKITNVKAQTINLENGNYVSSALNSNDVFNININQYYDKVKFALPNVHVGSIIEYEYSLIDENLYLIDAWDFQHELPTLSSKFELKINALIDYTNLTVGKKLNSKYKNKKNTTEWELINIPSLKEIKYAYNTDNFSEKIKLQMAGYQSAEGFKNTIASWSDLRKELNESNERNFNSSIVKKYAESIPTSGTEIEIFEQVLKHFKTNFKWNNFKGIYTSELQKNILNNKTANNADLNYLLNHILKQKGFDSNIILISSRQNGKLLTNFPLLDQFDLIVNVVKLKDGSVFVINASDISEDDNRFAPLYLFNDYGFNMDSNDSNFIEFNQFVSENEVKFKYSLKDENFVEQRIDIFDGYFFNKNADKKELINHYVSPAIYLINDDQLKEPIYKDKKYSVSQTKKKLFDSPDFLPIENPLKQFIDHYEFKEENRIVPVEFSFPYYQKVIVTIEIPEGYEVVKPDEFNHTVKKSEDLIYNQNFGQKDNILQIAYQLYVGNATFPSEQYKDLKAFFEEVQKDTNKQFVLRRKK